MYASEPQNIILTIERQGRIDKEAHVYYRTLDGSASHLEGDYVQIPTQKLVFAPQERQKTVQVSVLDDDVPEGNETFSVQLLDVGGERTAQFCENLLNPPVIVTLFTNKVFSIIAQNIS